MQQRIRLVYFSTISAKVTKLDLKSILAASNRNNSARRITGALAMNRYYFTQVLEGSRAVVSDLMIKILGDPRHRDVTVALAKSIEERAFPGWSMLWLGEESMNRGFRRAKAGEGAFDPNLLSGEQLEKIMIQAAQKPNPASPLEHVDRHLKSASK